MAYYASRNVSSDVQFVTGRLKRGLLDMLPSLPLDVLCEIFCFLHPVDLLVLARTSKAFRAFLLKRSAAFIWRSARRNVDGLPEPPSDMNEVLYASLVFGFGCHYQGCDRKARDTVWHLRIRSCAGCRPKHQPIKLSECYDYLDIRAMLACYPDTLEQYIPCGPFLSPKGKPVKGFQGHHIKTFADELRELPLSERQACLDRHKQATEVITQFASAGVAWQRVVRNVHITELRNKRVARAEMIRESLVGTGFKEEIDYFGWDRIRKHPLISSTQAMTDKAHSSALDQLRGYMLGWRELRMEEQVYAFRRQVFVDAWLEFTTVAFRNTPSGSPYLPLPPNAIVGSSESISAIIRQPGQTSHEFLLEQFRTTFLLACEYVLEWHQTVRRELAGLLPGYSADNNDETIHAQLSLATSIFHCNAGRGCRAKGRALAYPEILFHPCFTLVRPGNDPSPKDPWGIANHKACLAMGGSWNCKGRVEVHPKQNVVNKILQCCGKDPASTTAAEMDNQDLRLACTECALRDRVIVFMSWRRAVLHDITAHPDSAAKHSWSIASSLRIEIPEPTDLRPFSSVSGDALSDYAVCLLCPPRIPSWNTRFGLRDLIDHIKNKHGVPSPVFGTDYAFDTNITPIYFDLVIRKKQRNIRGC